MQVCIESYVFLHFFVSLDLIYKKVIISSIQWSLTIVLLIF